jgi:Zn-dependent protease with chaperone function
MADAYSVKLVGKEAMISLMDSFNKKDQEFLEILSKVDYDAFQLEKKRGDISRTHPLTERRLNTIKEMDYPDRVEDVHIPHR